LFVEIGYEHADYLQEARLSKLQSVPRFLWIRWPLYKVSYETLFPVSPSPALDAWQCIPPKDKRDAAVALLQLAHLSGLTAMTQVLLTVAELGGSVSVPAAINAYHQQVAANTALRGQAALLASQLGELLHNCAPQLQEQVRDGIWRLRDNYQADEKPFLVTAEAALFKERAVSKWVLDVGSNSSPYNPYHTTLLSALNESCVARCWHVRPGCEYQLARDLRRYTVSITLKDGDQSAAVVDRIVYGRLLSQAGRLRLVLRGPELV
jgi:hypothetical protein